MADATARSLAVADPATRFVEAFLGVGVVLGATTLAVYDVVGDGTASPALTGVVLLATVLGTAPFVTGRLSTDWLGVYLLAFVVGVMGLAALGTVASSALGGQPADDAVPPIAAVAVGHLLAVVGVRSRDVTLRPEPSPTDRP